jgi:dienelactone hydrolase
MTENDGTYLAEPPRAAGAGVLVVHDWYGLLPHVRAAGDELAAAGLVALAPTCTAAAPPPTRPRPRR